MAAPARLCESTRLVARALLAVSAAALAAAAAVAAPDSPPETALADYVAAPDDSFSWRVHARHEVPGAEIVELRLVSQTWRGIEWKHRLHLVKPDTVGTDAARSDADAAAQDADGSSAAESDAAAESGIVDSTSTQGFLFIGGGRWRERYDTEVETVLPDDAAIFIELARRLDTVVAVVGQIPYQPIFGLREDELIAHTFVQYLETGDAEWPLLLPMVKAAVRAMDATQAFAAQEWRVDLDRFTVAGGSKRGWTTWLAGAVDERAATLVPIVIDVLDFAAHMPHQKAAWGAPSEQIAPYTKRGLDEVFESDAGAGLRRIVDPYSYRDRLTQPKLIVLGTNDEYFPLDSLNLYWGELQGPKHVLYLPNQGHDAEDFARLIPAIAALHSSAEGDVALPHLEWGLERDDHGTSLCVRGSPAPSAVTIWTARSEDTDFRDERFAPREAMRADDVFLFEVVPPAAGYQAMFAEALFEDDRGAYMLSTNVQLLDEEGEAPFEATALDGRPGICPRG